VRLGGIGGQRASDARCRPPVVPRRGGDVAQSAPVFLDGGDEQRVDPHAHGARLHAVRPHRQSASGLSRAAVLQAAAPVAQSPAFRSRCDAVARGAASAATLRAGTTWSPGSFATTSAWIAWQGARGERSTWYQA